MSSSLPCALVTGGASGIGAATAAMFVADGWRVAVADRDRQGAERVCADLGASATAVTVDVRARGSVDAALAETTAELGTLDCVCVNAGITIPETPVEELPEEDLDLVLDVNLLGALRTVRAAVPHLADGGAIVITSSISGLVAHPLAAAYCASKAGLLGMQRSLVQELAHRRIRVNAVCPGAVDTPLHATTYGADAARLVREAAEANPLGRVASPEDVAEAIVFLACARHVNGVALKIDGGESICVYDY